MADLLTHVLAAYVGGAFAVRRGWVTDRCLPLLPVGAVAPDFVKLFVLTGTSLGTITGVPYNTWGLHTLGGVCVFAVLGSLTLPSRYRRRGAVLLAAGGVSHVLVDLLVVRADGLAPPFLFPFTTALVPAGNLYASADRWPLLVVAPVAIGVWLRRRRTD